MWDSLRTYVPKVKARVCPDKPFGVSLRLSAASAATLTADPAARKALKAFLDDNGLYLYTVNAFPYGPFKNQIIKEEVYEPDWSTAARAESTKQVAAILAKDQSGRGILPLGSGKKGQDAPPTFCDRRAQTRLKARAQQRRSKSRRITTP